MTSPGNDGGWASPSGQGSGWAAPGGPPPSGPVPPDQRFTQADAPPARWGAPYAPLDLRPGIVPLRPLAVGDILDGSLGMIRRYFRPVFAVSILVSVTVQALGFLITTASSYNESTAVGVGYFFLNLLVSQMAGLILAGPISALAGEAVLGRPTSMPEVWAKTRPRVGAILLTALLVAAMATVGLVLIFVPFVVVLVYFAFSTQAAVLEKLPARKALSRSAALVNGSFWRVFGILLLAAVIAGIVALVLTIPAIIVAGVVTGHLFTTTAGASSIASRAILAIGGALAGIFTLPFSAGVHSLLYMDRRMRVEGPRRVTAPGREHLRPALMADPDPFNRAGAAADAHRILQGPQYKSARPSIIQRIITRGINDIENSLSRASDAVGGPIVLIVLAVIVIVAIVLIRVKLGAVPLRDLMSGRGSSVTRLSASDYRGEAAAFAQRGEFGEAVRATTRAMVRELEDRGVLEPTPGSTTAALSSRAACAVPAVGADAALVAGTFDEIWYSGRPATATDAALTADAELRISRQRLRVTETLDVPDFTGLGNPVGNPVRADR